MILENHTPTRRDRPLLPQKKYKREIKNWIAHLEASVKWAYILRISALSSIWLAVRDLSVTLLSRTSVSQ